VPWEKISPDTKEGLVHSLREALESSNIRIVVEEVEEVPCTVGCKRPFVISHVHVENHL